jgi:tRNA-dihydrouridine synthase B
LLPAPDIASIRETLLEHARALHAFYGELAGVRIARKHLAWYAKGCRDNGAFRAVVNRAETAEEQLRLTRDYFDVLEADSARGFDVAA